MKQMSTDTHNQPGEMSTEGAFGCSSWLGYFCAVVFLIRLRLLPRITCSRWMWADWESVTWGELWKTCVWNHTHAFSACQELFTVDKWIHRSVKSGNAWISAVTVQSDGIVQLHCSYLLWIWFQKRIQSCTNKRNARLSWSRSHFIYSTLFYFILLLFFMVILQANFDISTHNTWSISKGLFTPGQTN